MMLRYRFLVCMFLGAALFFSGTVVHADCFNSTVNFDPNQGYISNHSWTHCLSDLPPNCVIVFCPESRHPLTELLQGQNHKENRGQTTFF